MDNDNAFCFLFHLVFFFYFTKKWCNKYVCAYILCTSENNYVGQIFARGIAGLQGT